jgi:glycosyltransferase involved in cell wall biosynthesis
MIVHNSTPGYAKPRIVFLTTSLSRSSGGPFLSVSGLAEAVAKDGGVNVSVVGAYANPSLWNEDQLQWSGTPIKAMAYGGLRSVPPLRDELAATLASDACHDTNALVHLHGLWDAASLALALLRNRLECPLVVSPRGMLEPWALAQRGIKKTVALRLWQHRLLVEATILHATSQMEYEGFRRLGFLNPVAIVPNGIRLPPDAVPRGGASPPSATPGLAPSRRCVFLSRIHPKKGLPILLNAWSRLRPQGWTLEIAGAGDQTHERQVREIIAALGLEGVSLVGDLRGPDKWAFLATADLFILPTYSENFGIAVAEAMAVGVPVITTHGTPWQVLEEQQMGWWVPVAEQALFSALQEAVSEPIPRLRARGERARRYVRDSFGWDSIGHRMRACYDWALGRGPLPADIVLA